MHDRVLRLLWAWKTEFADRTLSATVMRVVDRDLAAACTAQFLDRFVGAQAVHSSLVAAGALVAECLGHHSVRRVTTTSSTRAAFLPALLRGTLAGVVLAKLHPARARTFAALAAHAEDLLGAALAIRESVSTTGSRCKCNGHLRIARVCGAGASFLQGANTRVARALLC